MSSKPIVLMGLMGSGKSTLGQQLASQLNWDFVDLDTVIEEMAGSQIPDIFEKYGEGYFRKLEEEALYHETSSQKKVIALGGGAPCFFSNIDLIKKRTTSIYLRISHEELFQRLSTSATERPLAKDVQGERLRELISKQLKQREPYYLQADHIAESDNLNLLTLINLLNV